MFARLALPAEIGPLIIGSQGKSPYKKPKKKTQADWQAAVAAATGKA
jgi:hypothetical protein